MRRQRGRGETVRVQPGVGGGTPSGIGIYIGWASLLRVEGGSGHDLPGGWARSDGGDVSEALRNV